MKSIEIYYVCEDCPNPRPSVFTMHFLTKDSLWEMGDRVLLTAPFSTEKHDRTRYLCVKITEGKTFITYLTDKIPQGLLLIMREYKRLWNQAKEMAKNRTWVHAWSWAAPGWEIAAILRYMPSAEKELTDMTQPLNKTLSGEDTSPLARP